MTGQEGVAVLLIIALTTVTSVTGAGPIPLSPEEQAQRNNATAAMADLPPEDQMELPAGPVEPIPPCECHAHGDVRYVTCKGYAFKYNTLPTVIGVMAKPLVSWLWYVITEQEYFDGGPKTRLASVKFKVFYHYVKIEYKKTPDPDGLYKITVGKESAPGPPIAEFEESLGNDTVNPRVIFEGFGLEVSIIKENGDWCIEVRCTIPPAVLFDIRIRVCRHCLKIRIPPIWRAIIDGICDILKGLPKIISKPFRKFPK